VTERALKSMPSELERLVNILVETKSFKSSPVPIFPLASGTKSPYYIDCKIALSYPEARNLVGQLIYEKVRPLAIDAVGGLVIGAYPIAIAVSDVAYREDRRELRAFVIRKEAKEHGLKKVIEGDVRKGDRVVIVDDVITSGKSTIEAIVKSRNEGLEIVKAIALIDREEQEGKKNIELQGLKFEALLTLRDLLHAGKGTEVARR
jgi:orotate phosphoribosyltransferase